MAGGYVDVYVDRFVDLVERADDTVVEDHLCALTEEARRGEGDPRELAARLRQVALDTESPDSYGFGSFDDEDGCQRKAGLLRRAADSLAH